MILAHVHTHTHTHKDQHNTIKNKEINPHFYGQIIYDKVYTVGERELLQ